ncbi:MAG: tetratricopeptide repeat protein [Phycisphaerae bacterium]|jgi:tetratricopeptide (TPR) repeat protein|nr:tetratricopeptide repeat protein [Phycisphaerae bacterium]
MRKPVSTAVHALLLLFIVGAIQTPGYSQSKKSSEDRAAKLVLDSARRSYSSSQFDSAAARFSEFLTRYPKRPEAAAASYGKGLSLLKLRTLKSATSAVAAFRVSSGRIDFADRPLAIYYLGVSLRELASITLASKVTSGSDYRASNARTYRTEAARHFAGAADAFIARSKKSPPTTAPAVHPDVIWATRARSDQCDMLLRIGQYKQAIALAQSLLKDAATGKQFADKALYCMGYAHFALADYSNAGRTLSKLAPFKQRFGPHGRYMLARSHHLSGDMPEASQTYKALLDDYAARKTAATAAARRSYRSLTRDQRAAAAAILAGPPKPFIVRSIFYSALGLAESGRFGNALGGFNEFLTQYPKHPLAPEAQMRLGYCHMQLKSYAEAIKALDPLRKHPKHTERASWWIARSRVGAANPEVPQEYAKALATAITELTVAAKSAYSSGRNNPKAYIVYRDILIEMGDIQQLAGQYKDAVSSYSSAMQYNSDRSEEAMQRLATAYHLGGDYSRSQSTCDSFQKRYPKSTLLPAIWFRSAENACMSAIHSKTGYSRTQNDIDMAFKEAVNRYQRLLDKFPDFSEAHLARYGLATAQYRLRWYSEAMQTLASIPTADHSGKLAAVPYLIADCHIRTFPATTDNALTAGKLMTQATAAAKLLASFASGNAKSPKAPDALLKLGYCYQRLGSVLANDKAKITAYTNGKNAYALMIKNYPKDPLEPTARIELAKCMVLLGDSKSAINELDQFQRDPYRGNPVAPLAITQLSSLLRAGGRAIDAVRISKECLNLDRKNMPRDSIPAEWFIPLRYEYGLAIMETGKFSEAQSVFSDLVKRHRDKPEGVNSLWRTGQCQRRSLQTMMENLAKPGGANDEAGRNITRAATALATLADQLAARAKTVAKGSAAQLRLIYEAAWCRRLLGERELASARSKIRKEAWTMARARKSSGSPPGLAIDKAAPPRISPENVPLQDSEEQAMKLYQRLIALAPQSPMAARSRFELAEMHAYRRKHDQAVELLETILENSPPKDLAQQVRLRLAACLLDRGDPKRAATLIKLVSATAKGQQVGHVAYLTGEVYILQKEWSKAIETLRVFRDTETMRRMYSISDRALLRLAHAYEQTGNWSESRRSCETLISYTPKSPWIYEARFGMGKARERGKDYTNAIQEYNVVIANTVSALAARAQLRIGYCNAIQKKYAEAARAFLAIPMTYSYPEYNAEAWYKAGAAQVAMQKPDQAAISWKQLIRYYPESKWAQQAKAQLSKLPVTKKKK